ncbi:MAG: hypothetical protein V1725_04295 [archaeon]
MLDTKLMKKISDFVYVKPRTVQEVAHLINKNWRTADSYLAKIAAEEGTIGMRTFRGGTRGALKIVFWNNIEKVHSYAFQERLMQRIQTSSTKTDFSPFDIYQYVDPKKRHAFIEAQADDAKSVQQDLASELRKARHQVLLFSGNLSWANLSMRNKQMIDVFGELAKAKISIKILCRVDIASKKNVEKFLAINEQVGFDAVEIRHAEQPLRAFIIDKNMVRFKEIKNVHDYELRKTKRNYIFYDLLDVEWVEWTQNVFWNIFRVAIPARKRIEDMESIQQL